MSVVLLAIGSNSWLLCMLLSVPPFSLTLEARAVVAVSERVGLRSPENNYCVMLVISLDYVLIRAVLVRVKAIIELL